MVDSRFFSDLDVEEGRDQLPFHAYGMQELSTDACVAVCEQTNTRCVLLLGLEDVNVTAAYYCLPKNFMQSVYRQFPAFLDSYAYFNEWGANDKIVSMYSLTTQNAFNNRLEVLLLSVMDMDTSLYSIWIYTATGERYQMLETKEFAPEEVGNDITDVTHELFYFQTISNIRVVVQADNDYADIFFVGIHDTISSNNDVNEYCMKKKVTFNDDSGDFAQRIQTLTCTADERKSVSPSYKIANLHPHTASVHQVWLPLEVLASPQILLCNMSAVDNCNEATGERFTMQSTMYNFVKIVGLDEEVPVITTDDNVALLNRKFVSDFSDAAYEVDGATIKLNLLLVGSLSNTRSWLHNVKIALDTTSNQYVTNVKASEEVTQKIQIQSECSIDNCVACQTREPKSEYRDLQMKCYGAAECSIARCVGTLVNMRKPLCNIGKVALSLPLDAARISFGFMWQAIARQIVIIVEFSKQRRNVYVLSTQQEAFTALTCQAKDQIVASSAILTSIVGALTSSLSSFGEHDLSPTSQILDSDTNAQIVLGMTAMTNFLASVGMAPIYVALISNKILECKQDLALSIFNNIGGLSGVNIQLSLRQEAIQNATDSTVGMCLTEFGKEAMRDMSDKSASEKIQTRQ